MTGSPRRGPGFVNVQIGMASLFLPSSPASSLVFTRVRPRGAPRLSVLGPHALCHLGLARPRVAGGARAQVPAAPLAVPAPLDVAEEEQDERVRPRSAHAAWVSGNARTRRSSGHS